jgi:hypothetical protein
MPIKQSIPLDGMMLHRRIMDPRPAGRGWRAGAGAANSPRFRAIVLAALCSLVLAGPASAARPGASGNLPWLAQASAAVSADEAAALVRSASGGRILGVRRINTPQGPAYRVRVLLDGGRVRVYLVDAGSGEIVR